MKKPKFASMNKISMPFPLKRIATMFLIQAKAQPYPAAKAPNKKKWMLIDANAMAEISRYRLISC